MIATIRWTALALFLICMGVASTGAKSWMLAGLAAVTAVTCLLTFMPRPRRPFAVTITEDHPDAVTRLDRLDGVGARREFPAGGVTPRRDDPSVTPPPAGYHADCRTCDVARAVRPGDGR